MVNYIKTWNFRIDAIKQYLGEAIDIIRQDTYSNKFVITCLSNGYPIDLTDLTYATVTFTKSDGFVVVSTADVVDATKGRIEVAVDYQAITAIGICTVSVKLYFGVTIITLTNFPLNVILDPYDGTDGGVASTSEYPILTQLIADVTAMGDIVGPVAEDELERQANELIRISNESGRVTTESTRVTSEGTRVSNESTRGTNETARAGAESTRLSNESSRVSAESSRSSAESTRVSNESGRTSAESTRVSSESARVTSEGNRSTAEATRASNETIRQQFTFLGDYSGTTDYKVNNVVSFLGSSYACILNSTGNLPTNTTYFRLVAQKGTDGAGAGDMLKSTYDQAGNGVVDDSEKLGGQLPSYYIYSHPANHPPSIILQDVTNRFVTDAEKAAWNAKQEAVSNYNAKLSADVQLTTTGTWYDGPSISLPAGTYLVSAMATIGRTAITAVTHVARISDGTNHYASASDYRASVANNWANLHMMTIITLAETTTIKLQATTSAGATTNLLKAATANYSSGNNATQISAIKIA